MWTKSKIENNILNNPAYKSVRELLKESIATYNIGAYRAAYILSYQALLKQVKINMEICPEDNFKKVIPSYTKYQSLMEKLSDSSKWEQAVFDELNTKPSGNLFRFNENDRSTFIVAKDYRNTTAHAKDDGPEITETKVHWLWELMEQYAYKIFVGGGTELWKEKYNNVSNIYEGNIPPDRLQELVDLFMTIDPKEKVGFLNYVLLNNKHTSTIYSFINAYHEQEPQDFCNTVNSSLELQLYTPLLINNFNISSLNIERDRLEKLFTDEILRENTFATIRMYAQKISEENFIKYLQVVSLPYNDRKLPSSWHYTYEYILEDLCIFGEIDYKSIESVLNDSRLSFEMQTNLFEYILSYVEKKYQYKNGFGKTYKTNTFDFWNFNKYDAYLIIFCFNCSNKLLPSLQMFNDRTKEVKKRLEYLYQLDSTFINFQTLYECIEKDAALKEKLVIEQ